MSVVKHAILHGAGAVLYPFAKGYMNAKYRRKLHVSRFRDQITLLYARADGTPVVIPIVEAMKLDSEELGRWFHSEVALLNRGQPVPQLDKFCDAAKRAHELAHSSTPTTPGSVPRFGIPILAI